MGGIHWLYSHFETVLTNIGIIGGLFFTAISFRSEAKTRRVANLLTVTANHREIWSTLYTHGDLGRVLNRTVDLNESPLTSGEEVFVTSVILHLASVFYALQDDLLIKEERLRADIADFLSYPIPAMTWERIKSFQNEKFVRFVENSKALNSKDSLRLS